MQSWVLGTQGGGDALGFGVGKPPAYVGTDDGRGVGLSVGEPLGAGVGLPASNVGDNEGVDVGRDVGRYVGNIVGLPGKYVGADDGAVEGEFAITETRIVPVQLDEE